MKKVTFKTKQIVILLAAMGGLATLSFNCAPNMFQSAKFYNSDSSALNQGKFDKPESPWVLLTTNQQFQSMLNVTGQATSMTAQQKAEYDLRTGALAGNDNIAGVNGPLMMGTSSMAGEICNGLLVKEKAMVDPASRTFFGAIDFNKSIANNSPDAYASVADIMAMNFYGRHLSTDEQQILTDYYSEFVGNLTSTSAAAAAATKETTNLYLSLCSGMLASFDSMTY